MEKEILDKLKEITPEEERILSKKAGIDKAIYMSSDNNVVDAKKLLDEGKLIQVRPHTRFLHFKVADILPIKNLVENLIWTILNKQPNKRSINQVTMGVLFLQLLNHMDKLQTDETVKSGCFSP